MDITAYFTYNSESNRFAAVFSPFNKPKKTWSDTSIPNLPFSCLVILRSQCYISPLFYIHNTSSLPLSSSGVRHEAPGVQTDPSRARPDRTHPFWTVKLPFLLLTDCQPKERKIKMHQVTTCLFINLSFSISKEQKGDRDQNLKYYFEKVASIKFEKDLASFY